MTYGGPYIPEEHLLYCEQCGDEFDWLDLPGDADPEEPGPEWVCTRCQVACAECRGAGCRACRGRGKVS